jgi:hypothetical protein
VNDRTPKGIERISISWPNPPRGYPYPGWALYHVKIHGDIGFNSFPYQLDDELEYVDPEEIYRWWTSEYP